MRPTRSIGILREVKNKWERRVAITPKEVKKLVENHNISVRIQPCERRVFQDIQYTEAGATVTNDLSGSSIIVGVKEFPSANLLLNHSYLIFSHVIKGQLQNMSFLDSCLKKNIRLFDYECIREPPKLNDTSTSLPSRLVAFGNFAGLAGMITGLRGLGEHLLAKGSATPFLNISSAYMYDSLSSAKASLLSTGALIAQYGLPERLGPLTFVFTGAGNVTQGALELFKLLPHEFIEAKDLPQLKNNFSPFKVYGCILPVSELVEHSNPSKGNFVKQHYYDFPEEYYPKFHTNIAPYTSVLVNGMYWDHRYPRLLTNEQTLELKHKYPNAMLALFDITCDIEGSVEFLKKSTTTDNPFYVYNPMTNDISSNMDGNGILVLGVDALPAELPREASEYFSASLYPFLVSLATSDSSVPFSDQTQDLPMEMYNACITSNNKLTPNYTYIDTIRTKKESIADDFEEKTVKAQAVLRIDGHLFDSGLINDIFDMIEKDNGDYHILHLKSRVNTPELIRGSQLILQIDVNHIRLQSLIEKIKHLVVNCTEAKATFIQMPFGASHQWSSDTSVDTQDIDYENRPTFKKIVQNANRIGPENKILILGSGYVCKPVIEYLCYSGNNKITVASNDFDSALNLCSNLSFADAIHFDASSHSIMEQLIEGHNIVVSLLPATMHIPIAEACIKYGRDLVTASYISPQMFELDEKAKEANVVLLNEVGLDPGLDHMSALKIIREIQSKSGEFVNSFSSVCGGLPAPECANNSLGYKFSWSPMGVLRASLNSAKYMTDGKIVDIDGNDLLLNGKNLSPNPYPSLALEEIPNRNSMEYISQYSLNEEQLHSMYRGTLRYSGFSQLLYGCKVIGLMDNDLLFANVVNEEWNEYLRRLIAIKFGVFDGQLSSMIVEILRANTEWNDENIRRFLDFLQWLKILDENGSNLVFDGVYDGTPMEIFCELLQNKLFYDVDERDMVLMYHRIGTNTNLMYESSLLVFGDEEYSAMARTVGFPVAISCQLLLNKKGSKVSVGVISGGHESIAGPVLDGCEQLGIKFKENIRQLNHTPSKL